MNKVRLSIPAISGQGTYMEVDGAPQDMNGVSRLSLDAKPDEITTIFLQMPAEVELECEARVEVQKVEVGPNAHEILTNFFDQINPSDLEEFMLSDGLRKNPAVAALDYLHQQVMTWEGPPNGH